MTPEKIQPITPFMKKDRLGQRRNPPAGSPICATDKKWQYPPTPLPQEDVRILLIINIGRKNTGNHATMCMIASELGPKPKKSTLYFQHDKLWISRETPNNGRRSHDVYDQKGVNLKNPKSCRLFSIGCGGENSENGAKLCAEATISMIAKTLGSKSGKAAENYVIEIRRLSVLALEKEFEISHDLYDGNRFGLKWPLFIHHPPRRLASLYVASTLG